MVGAESWIIAWFSAERALGGIRSSATGEEATFGVEVWCPCEPATARALAENHRRRHLLLPRAGESVEVLWGTSRDAKRAVRRVTRSEPLDVPPLVPFLHWLHDLGQHVAAVADWDARDWDLVFRHDEEGGLEDTVRSTQPDTPEKHLAVLDWIRLHAPNPVARRLSWLRDARPALDAIDDASSPAKLPRGAVEVWDRDEPLFLDLPPDVVARLIAERLVVPAEERETTEGSSAST